MASWLQRQRKAELVDLAEEAGMQGSVSHMRKDEILVVLQQHLQANASSLSKNPTFHDYFNRMSSPVKKEPETIASDISDDVPNTVRSRGRPRLVKTPQSETDLESSPGPLTTVVSRVRQVVQVTVEPAVGSVQEFAATLPLPIPPSPAAVADLVERRTGLAADNIRRYYASHHIPNYIASIRGALSNVYAIDSAFILLEASGLQRTTLPWKYAFSLPSSKLTGNAPLRVEIPDFFVLLDGSFWGPTWLWVSTSILLPMLFGYLINFRLLHGKHRRGSYDIDPLVFNMAKIITTWLVFSQGYTLSGLFSESTVSLVGASVTGGPFTMAHGAGICALFSVYEAILRK